MNRTQEQINAAQAQGRLQMKTMAVNINGVAIKEMFVDHPEFEVIKGWTCSSKTIDATLEDLRKDGKPLYRDDLTITPEEQSGVQDVEEGENRRTYVVVGYALRDKENKDLTKEISETKKGRFGTETPEDLQDWTGENVYLVVIPRGSDTNKLFAMCGPQNGLCTAGSVRNEEVFMRHEFRSNAQFKTRREGALREKLEQACKIPKKDHAEEWVQTKIGGKTTAMPIRVSRTRSLGAELGVLVASWQESENVWYLEEMTKVLTRIDEDLEYCPAAEAFNLRKFVEDESTWDLDGNEEDLAVAKGFVTEALESWPSIEEHLTVKMAGDLHNALVRNEVALEYRLLGPFVKECTYRLSQLDEGDVHLAIDAIVPDVHRAALLMMPKPTSKPLAAGGSEMMIVRAVYHKLKEIKSAAGADTEALKSSGTDAIAPHSLAQIWPKGIAARQDVATVRAMLLQACRTIIDHLDYKELEFVRSVNELVIILEKLFENEEK